MYIGDQVYLIIFAVSVTVLSIWFRRIQKSRFHKKLSKKQKEELKQ